MAPVIQTLNQRLTERGGLTRYAMHHPYTITEVRPVMGGYEFKSAHDGGAWWYPATPSVIAKIAEDIGLNICRECGPTGQAFRFCMTCGETYCKWCSGCKCDA